jgi:hypothetical protein
MSLLKIPLPGYMAVTPSRLYWRGDLQGNANYQQSGDKIYASDFGMVGLETASGEFGGFSASNNYYVKIFPPANFANVNETQAASFNNVSVYWYIASNNAAVANNTNLAAEFVRISATGL